MSDSKHTPGPWVVSSYRNSINGATGSSVAFLPIGGEMNANARLIASAPELAEALEIVLGYLIDDGPVRTEDGAIAVARAALKKAGIE